MSREKERPWWDDLVVGAQHTFLAGGTVAGGRHPPQPRRRVDLTKTATAGGSLPEEKHIENAMKQTAVNSFRT